MSAAPRRFRFSRSMRLSRASDFSAAFRDGLRRSRGPLVVFMRPNGLNQHRLGLSVGRRVGGAVTRNRIKRQIREAFRKTRPDLDGAFDIVVKIRPHEPLAAGECERLFTECAHALAKEWARRRRKREESDGS